MNKRKAAGLSLAVVGIIFVIYNLFVFLLIKPQTSAFWISYVFMEGAGYQVQLTDEKHRDYKIIQVEDQKYKIVRNKGWTTYDVIMTA